jgi:hypothetical protein
VILMVAFMSGIGTTARGYAVSLPVSATTVDPGMAAVAESAIPRYR